MENFKKNWPEIVFKIIVSIFSIFMGAHEVQIHTGGDKPLVQYEAGK